MQSLCTLRNRCRQRPRNTRYQADATPYLDRTFTGWIAPACGWRTYLSPFQEQPDLLEHALCFGVLLQRKMILSPATLRTVHRKFRRQALALPRKAAPGRPACA